MISRKISKHVVAEVDDIHAPPFWRRREAVMLAAILILSLPVLFYLGFPLMSLDGDFPSPGIRYVRQHEFHLRE